MRITYDFWFVDNRPIFMQPAITFYRIEGSRYDITMIHITDQLTLGM